MTADFTGWNSGQQTGKVEKPTGTYPTLRAVPRLPHVRLSNETMIEDALKVATGVTPT
jgi:hypothetical protein